MNVQKLAAFTSDGVGGNPAGVAIAETFPSDEIMLSIAAEVGFSETVFAVKIPSDDHNAWRVRYFSPDNEVDFCGHATIALGAALGQHAGAGHYQLHINNAVISVSANPDGSATLTSPETKTKQIKAALKDAVMTAFSIAHGDLDTKIGVQLVHAGNDHVLIGLNNRRALAGMDYDFNAMRHIMVRDKIVTIALVFRENAEIIHVRNAFAFGGVFEDPATGAAAAAISGFLREQNLLDFREGAANVTFYQGDDMKVPCKLMAKIPQQAGAGIPLTGYTRKI